MSGDQDAAAGAGAAPGASERVGSARVLVLGDSGPLTQRVVEALRESPAIGTCRAVAEAPTAGSLAGADVLVYLAAARPGAGSGPGLADAAALLGRPGWRALHGLVLVSSAAVHEPHHAHPGMVSEDRLAKRRPRNRITAAWRELEARFRDAFEGRPGTRLTVVRPAAVPLAGGGAPFARLLARRVAVTSAGYDPPLQLLDPEDLGRGLRRAIEHGAGGVFHLAPREVVPLRQALALAGVRRLPLPLWGHLFGRFGRRADRLDFLRYSSTVSGRRAAEVLGFEPRFSSAEAVVRARRGTAPPRESSASLPSFDEFGHDKGVIAAKGRRLQGFLYERYWRIEVRGAAKIPAGAAVLVGIHRGFMPWDGVMAVHSVLRGSGRYVRFLIHPTLVKFPFLFNVMTKLGGVIACVENADRLLERGGLVGMFPEGIRGAFSYYRDAYELKRFGRDQFVRMALRNRAPLVPFVTLGSAETFPILAKVQWRWWKRFAEWPCLPITPTFPLLPVPLPTKWHTLFLEPMHIENEYPPEAADDPALVRDISQRVRELLGRTLAEMRARRCSVFRGSIFDPEPTGGLR